MVTQDDKRNEPVKAQARLYRGPPTMSRLIGTRGSTMPRPWRNLVRAHAYCQGDDSDSLPSRAVEVFTAAGIRSRLPRVAHAKPDNASTSLAASPSQIRSIAGDCVGRFAHGFGYFPALFCSYVFSACRVLPWPLAAQQTPADPSQCGHNHGLLPASRRSVRVLGHYNDPVVRDEL